MAKLDLKKDVLEMPVEIASPTFSIRMDDFHDNQIIKLFFTLLFPILMM